MHSLHKYSVYMCVLERLITATWEFLSHFINRHIGTTSTYMYRVSIEIYVHIANSIGPCNETYIKILSFDLAHKPEMVEKKGQFAIVNSFNKNTPLIRQMHIHHLK